MPFRANAGQACQAPSITPVGVLAAGFGGGLLSGAAVARLTVGLNPQLSAAGRWPRALLLAELSVLYGVLGLAAGAVAAAALVLAVRRIGRRGLRRWLERSLVALLLAGPAVYLLLLPDVGLAGSFLTRHLFAAGPAHRAAAAGALLAAATAAGLLAGVLAARLAAGLLGKSPRRSPRGLAIVAGLLVLAAFATTVVGPGAPATAAAAPAPAATAGTAALGTAGTANGDPPAPVVLLGIDGADLGVIRPMAAAGELPTFARLIRGGTWGYLETLEPTRSPPVWTTVATGKSPAEHGIRDFVCFRLPGIRPAVDRFPRHSGLNHELFPLLESLPGLGFRRAPYTSGQRRVRALWEIAGERYPVGVYRWLVTWPAEEVNGFAVAGGVIAGPGRWHPGAARWVRELRDRPPEGLAALDRHPPDLAIGAAPRPRRRWEDRMLAAYVSGPVDRSSPGVRTIRRSLRDPTIRELPALMREYRPRFTAAAFYSVDAFQHRFAADRRRGGPFAGALAERYRHADRMLKRLLGALAPETHLIVISDHGFDFELGHHRQAPPGLFLARGPAFAAGRRIDGLSVYDIAPLCLHLLGLPLPEDMPGTLTGAYRRALDRGYLDRHPAARIATYERGPRDAGTAAGALDEELERELRSLGYIQ